MTVTEELLSEMTRRLVRELQPEEIILFGSRAWGSPNEDSDVDLFVVLPDGQPVTHERAAAAHQCMSGLGVSKDIILRSRRDAERFRGVPASLEALVFSRGRVLYA